MSNSSSDKAAESKSPRPDSSNKITSNEEQSDYYYDDATGYEIYEEEEDKEDEDTEPQAVASGSMSSNPPEALYLAHYCSRFWHAHRNAPV